MSPPPANWRIIGGENFKSETRAKTDAARARTEWDHLKREIEAMGGEVLTLPAPDVEPPHTGLMYAANWGQAFGNKFALAQMKVAHRQREAALIRTFVESIDFEVIDAPHTWEGQADICILDDDRVLLTHGPRSDRASADWVARTLFPRATTLTLELREPYFHGDVSHVWVEGLLFACRDAFVNLDETALRDFAGDVVWVPSDEARAYALNSLPSGGGILVARGVKTDFGLNLVREVDLAELCGKGGGGPRCLVNRLSD
jgi:N-dimethylarginine dimethylaminohydrolase